MTSEDNEFLQQLQQARAKLQEAERAWYKAFCAAPLGAERIWAGEVYERVRLAGRRE